DDPAGEPVHRSPHPQETEIGLHAFHCELLLSVSSVGFTPALLQSEKYREVEYDRDGLSVELTRLELPSFHRFHRGVAESHRQGLEHAGVRDVAVPIDDRLDDHDTFDSRL